METRLETETQSRILAGLRAVASGNRIDFETADHLIKVSFSGEAHAFEANRVLDFYNYLSDCVYRRPFIAGMTGGCFKVLYGYTMLSPQSEERLREALHHTSVAPLAGDIGIEQVEYRKLAYRFSDTHAPARGREHPRSLHR